MDEILYLLCGPGAVYPTTSPDDLPLPSLADLLPGAIASGLSVALALSLYLFV